MLLNLHVKNLALIEEADVYFAEGLNILTGETGAGKSIIIGSINLGLGGKISRDLIRESSEFAQVELVFHVEEPELIEKIKELDVIPEEGQIILSRKIMKGKSISKVNGEIVPVSTLKTIGELLIDIHGQHEHQSLLYKKNHLEILDQFAKKEIQPLKKELTFLYAEYISHKKKLEDSMLNEENREREVSFTEFEVNEIIKAALVKGEDSELEDRHRRLIHGKKIAEVVRSVYHSTGYEETDAAGEQIGRSIRELSTVTEYDKNLEGLWSQLSDIDGLLGDFNRELMTYAETLDFSPESFREIEDRLDVINYLKSKYGPSIDRILDYKEKKEERLEQLKNYEDYVNSLKDKCMETEDKLKEISLKISNIRKKYASKLVVKIKEGLIDLNFLDVQFEMVFKNLDHYTNNGIDDGEFMISTNPGEKIRPLASVASGGELSRIMLAIKTVLADEDSTGTLIFDEIDVGISGRTAQMVSEKLAVIGKNHQVICITHLPQIAAMADSHFAIEKNVIKNETITSIKKLNENEIIEELARILGGAKITDTILESAKEMKELANCTKLY